MKPRCSEITLSASGGSLPRGSGARTPPPRRARPCRRRRRAAVPRGVVRRSRRSRPPSVVKRRSHYERVMHQCGPWNRVRPSSEGPDAAGPPGDTDERTPKGIPLFCRYGVLGSLPRGLTAITSVARRENGRPKAGRFAAGARPPATGGRSGRRTRPSRVRRSPAPRAPARVARQRISWPLRVAVTGRPNTDTLTDVGTNPSSSRIVVPRRTTACFADFEIGAPQRCPQHQDETASGTLPEPVCRYAEGGRATPSSKASRIDIEPSLAPGHETCDQPEKIRSRSGESLCRVTRVRG